MTDNVILFPKAKRDSPPQSLEEITDRVTETRKEHIEAVIQSMIYDLMGMFNAYGIDVSDDKYTKDVAMVIESLKAMLSRYYSIDHPFHIMVDKIFEYSYNEDSGVDYTFTMTVPKEEE